MQDPQQILELAVTLAAAGGGGVYIKKTVARLERQAEEDRREIQALKTEMAVVKAKRAGTAGRLKQVSDQLAAAIKDQGKLEANVAKVWEFLTRKFNGEARRISDAMKGDDHG